VDLERAALTERQGNGGGTNKADVLQGDNTVRYNWRADLTDNTYKYDKLVEPLGPDRKDTPVTSTVNLQPIRALTSWIDEIHGKRGDAARGRHRADSPISHHNSWERVATHHTNDTPSGVYDGGVACVPETPTEKGNERPSVARPKGDTQSGVFDGGGERVPETPPAASDNRPTRAYAIRVDKLKQTNNGLRDTRDKLKLDKRDKLKLCTAATQSSDSVATEPTTQ